MGKVMLQQPRNQLPRQLLVVVPPVRAVRLGSAGLMLPTAGVQLVDVQRAVAAFVPPLHPRGVVKGEIQLCQLAGGGGAQLGGKGVGVAAHHGAAVGAVDAVFVQVPLRKAGDKGAPHAGIGFFPWARRAPSRQSRRTPPRRWHRVPTRQNASPRRRLGRCRVRTQNAVGIEAVATEKRAGDHRVIHAKISLLLYVDRRAVRRLVQSYLGKLSKKNVFLPAQWPIILANLDKNRQKIHIFARGCGILLLPPCGRCNFLSNRMGANDHGLV